MVVQLTPEWLEVEKQMGGRAALQGTVEEMSAQFDAMVGAFASVLPPPDPDVKREDKTVSGVPVRIYTPPGATGKEPVGIHAHGGGYALGDLDTELLLCDAVSKHCNSVVVSVDYRLAPKHKHPAALEDCLKVWKWAYDNAESIGGDKTKFFTIGTSAGGALSLSIANAVVKDSATRSQIKGCVALSPLAIHPDNVPSAYKADYRSWAENSDAPIIDQKSMNSFYEWVGASSTDADNFVALDEKNHQYFPPTYFAACEADPLRDDAVIMQKLLEKSGVKTKLDLYKGLPHVFWAVPTLPESQQAVMNVLGGVGFVLSS